MRKLFSVVGLMGVMCIAKGVMAVQPATVEVVPRPDFAPHMQVARQQRLNAEDASADLQRQLSKIQSFTASYQQKVYDIQQQLLQQGTGTLALQQGARFRFESVEPEPSLLVSDGETLWIYNELLEQVSIYDAQSEVGQTPFALLTSQAPTLWQQYRVTKQQDSFFIHPHSSDNPVQQLLLTFNEDRLIEMQVIDINQQQSVFLFQNIQLNQSIAATQFRFTVSNHLDVDDQRQR